MPLMSFRFVPTSVRKWQPDKGSPIHYMEAVITNPEGIRSATLELSSRTVDFGSVPEFVDGLPHKADAEVTFITKDGKTTKLDVLQWRCEPLFVPAPAK